jgi:hypothetical protein
MVLCASVFALLRQRLRHQFAKAIDVGSLNPTHYRDQIMGRVYPNKRSTSTDTKVA